MLKKIKKGVLTTAKSLGILNWVQKSAWRRERLLILGYHGVSIHDEHEWNPQLFMSAKFLRRRFEAIRASSHVLPLEEAINRTYEGTLPSNAVAITFDDGLYDFYKIALPIIKEFGFPVTVYLTTFYSGFNKPVFTVALSYILWKARTKAFSPDDRYGILNEIELAGPEGRSQVQTKIIETCLANDLTAVQKDQLLVELCERLGLSYHNIFKDRVLHLMTPDEVRTVSDSGINVQLHTHR